MKKVYTVFIAVYKGSCMYQCAKCGTRLKKHEIGFACPGCGKEVLYARDEV